MRDYIHVEDLGDAHLLALDGRTAGRAPRSSTSATGNGFSVREVIEAARARDRAGDPGRRGGRAAPATRRSSSPPTRADPRDELGWEPRKPALETMIADAWAWHQAHPRRLRD